MGPWEGGSAELWSGLPFQESQGTQWEGSTHLPWKCGHSLPQESQRRDHGQLKFVRAERHSYQTFHGKILSCALT